jgi:hypothetical protein
VRASDYVRELASADDLASFLAATPATQIAIVNVSLATATPCVRVFPVVMALAKHLRGVASFARLIGDGGSHAAALTRELGVIEAPTFIFYIEGKEVARHVGSSRGDLMGQILEVQATLGTPLPTVERRRTPRVPASQGPARRASGQSMWR